MNRVVFLVALAALLETGAAPPQPLAPARQAELSAMRIASFRAGPVRCGGFEKVPIRAVTPLPTAAAVAEPEPIRFRFRIDQEGRPLGIRQIGGPANPALDISDLAPALVAWRFEPGAGQTDCEIAFTVQLDTVEGADEALIYRYAALGRMQIPGGNGGALIGQAFARLRPSGSTCTADPVPRAPIDLRFQSIPEFPGGMSYSFFSYDVDGQGRPVHIRLLNSSGNRLLDMEADVAIGRARFPPRPRTGCLYYFYRVSTRAVPAPTEPPADVPATSAACADDIPRQVAAHFRMRYPVEFMRRPAEGWVVFSYDVATSGELGNIRIVASEPAARFGEEVSRAAAEVRVSAIPGAQRGCVQRVRFLLSRR
jgi:TonB family protein